MAIKIDWYDVLDVFCWGIETLGRPSVHRALHGYDDPRYRSPGKWFWHRLESEQWLRRKGRGKHAKFTITEKGRQRCAEADPRAGWDRIWDRQWRIVTFDIPEVRRKDRLALWREFRARKLGFLQRSVWVWPHPMETILQEVIHARGVPECFAGFECARVFLCTHEEIAQSAWDFEAIRKAHEAYRKKANGLRAAIRGAKDLPSLARAARQERLAYLEAMAEDPILPRVLLPKGYVGFDVRDCHERARTELAQRLPRVLE